MAENKKLSLFAAFAAIPDPRHAQGLRHSLQAVLTMTTAAILCGCKGVDAIAQWGRVNLIPGSEWYRRFGFDSYTTPAASTLHEIFKALDAAQVESVLGAWAEGLVSGFLPRHVCVDGKTLRGARPQPEAPGVHLLSAFAREPGCTLRQQRVPEETNEPKAALSLLAPMILEDTVISGDAIFCQKELCAAIVEQQGDYLFVVKDNQPQLKATVAAAFESPVSPLRARLVACGGG